MKATKTQIADVTKTAKEMNFPVDLALHTLSNCSLSIYKAIGSKGIIESSRRSNSKNFVDTLSLSAKASKMGVSIESLMTPEQIAANK